MALSFQPHDHDHCMSDALATAEELCADKKLRLTPIRKLVYEILLTDHRAMGAYQILDELKKRGEKSQPPVAYRALDFLQQHGFVHKIERLNAFIACTHPHDGHKPVFLICRSCDQVAEAHAELSEGRLGRAADEAGFEIEKTVVEAVGLCPNCKDETD
ncbi:MAG: Fur family transcriptional regulator [Pseudomonadota bacterium]